MWSFLRGHVERLLTQLDRDLDSPTCGCFDRDFWHYKIRDFSSIILQQSILALDVLERTELPGNPLYGHGLPRAWAEAGMRFWASRQLRSGAFEEYYPFESGFPPTAFSLYAVGLAQHARGLAQPDESMTHAMTRASAWLLDNREAQALNQEMAGLAGLALAARVPGVQVDAARLEARLERFFADQSPEGWLPEYGGPDLGYLSVTLDCLWDYWELTGDQRAMRAMESATAFLADFVTPEGRPPVMINARNTDYIVPYGLTRLARTNPTASAVVHALFDAVDEPGHFLAATDDRYMCHYVFNSCFRCLEHLDAMTEPGPLPRDTGRKVYHRESRIYVHHGAAQGGDHSVFVAAGKGGVTYVCGPGGPVFADYGYRLTQDRKQYAVNHWQDASMLVQVLETSSETKVEIHGEMSLHGFFQSTPLRHMGLRVLSLAFGRKLIPWLKKLLIFRSAASPLRFQRLVEVSQHGLRIHDLLSGVDFTAWILEDAPHHSFRHVASASRFSCEELLPLPTGRTRTSPDATTLELELEVQIPPTQDS